MKVNVVINGSVSLTIIPENKMEEEALKQLSKQRNEIIEIRNTLSILSKSIPVGSLLISQQIITESTSVNSDLKYDEKESEEM
jgi:hypothetical protein